MTKKIFGLKGLVIKKYIDMIFCAIFFTGAGMALKTLTFPLRKLIQYGVQAYICKKANSLIQHTEKGD